MSPGCRPLAQALLGYAGAVVSAAEGVDQLDGARVQAGRRLADAALARVDRLGADVHVARPAWRPSQPGELTVPRAGEAFFGDVRAQRTTGTWRGSTSTGSSCACSTAGADAPLHGCTCRPGRYDLELRFFRRGRLVARSAAPDAYLLPATARQRRAALTTDARLQGELRALGAAFPGWAAIYTHDLRTGRAAGWNADALFPAASTVKLGVLAAVAPAAGARAAWSRTCGR